MTLAHVDGLGLWAPGFAGLAAWRAGKPDPAVRAPRPEALPAAMRRRVSPLAAMVADAAGQAMAASGAALGETPLVLGSVYGEVASAVAILRELHEGEGMPSPTRFHNSVHHAAAAYLSMASGNRGFVTAIAAGPETPAGALQEALALLAVRGGGVLVVLADEPPPPPLDLVRPYAPAAVALHLTAGRGPRSRASLRGLRRAAGAPAVAPPLTHHPASGAIALAEAVAGGGGTVSLCAPPGRGWAVDVEVLP